MKNTPDWARLKTEGRAKDIGVPWVEAEAVLLAELYTERGVARSIAAAYLRGGVDSLAEYDEALKQEEPLELENREQLFLDAGEAGLNVTPDTPTDVLVAELQQKVVKKKSSKKEVAPKKEKPLVEVKKAK